ncbi:hypothetical protein MIND_00924600 [Mycena indigotica]|uniref:F-box domain-containing protein n=1 Tax=Mycena indigotica TaxID=2126181 RepID=A0A8H6W0C3_9AGAR|nr:uncharacterized protein MIND_00924600 [Mycena indigotica]KAF7296928.1 hypothetical protein MIND_00924600 [Mycena indigotica]
MHQSLEIPEIVRLIIAQFAAGAKHASNLRSLGLACRAFLEPVLDEMWHTQINLTGFLRTFPADAMRVEYSQTASEWDVQILRPLVPTDWERPLFYAHRVRSYRAFEDHRRNFAEVLGILSTSLPDAHSGLLFPRLDSLVWSHSNASTCFYITLFLAPTLRMLNMASPLLVSLLPRLPGRLPHIEIVTINLGLVKEATYGPPMSLFIQNLTSIVVLNIPVAAWQDLIHLSGLRRLMALAIGQLVGPTPQEIEARAPWRSDAFSTLRSLTFTSAPIKAVSAFFEAISSVELEKLDIGLNCLASTAAIGSLYLLIASRCSPATLTTFCQRTKLLDGREIDDAEIPQKRINVAALRELRVLRGLKKLAISSPAGFDLNDAGMTDIAHAFPQLEELVLADPIPDSDELDDDGQRPTPLTVTHVTLAGLRTLGEHCPKLFRLGLSFDASIIPTPRQPTRGKLRGPFSALAELHVRNSVLDDSIGVARFLSGVFPGAQIMSDEYGALPLSDHWESVLELWEPFVAARQEEREWARHELELELQSDDAMVE